MITKKHLAISRDDDRRRDFPDAPMDVYDVYDAVINCDWHTVVPKSYKQADAEKDLTHFVMQEIYGDIQSRLRDILPMAYMHDDIRLHTAISEILDMIEGASE